MEVKLARRKRINKDHQYRYDVCVKDWYVNVQFNDYAYLNLFDREEYEEYIYMVLEGRISSTMSKKCKKDMPAKVVIHSGDFWYDKSRLRDDVHTIGNMDIQKANPYTDKEDALYFRVSVPTKSYENIRGYLTYKGKALISLVGTELYRRKGEIYYLGFGKES